jgi:hypothetical protein
MTTDTLIERLRALARAEHDDLSIGDEAADEIERLRDFLAIWISDGSLQTFDHREKFRVAAKALLGA